MSNVLLPGTPSCRFPCKAPCWVSAEGCWILFPPEPVCSRLPPSELSPRLTGELGSVWSLPFQTSVVFEVLWS